MTHAVTHTISAVAVFAKKDQVLPMGITLKLSGAAIDWALLISIKDTDQALREECRHFAILLVIVDA